MTDLLTLLDLSEQIYLHYIKETPVLSDTEQQGLTHPYW